MFKISNTEVVNRRDGDGSITETGGTVGTHNDPRGVSATDPTRDRMGPATPTSRRAGGVGATTEMSTYLEIGYGLSPSRVSPTHDLDLHPTIPRGFRRSGGFEGLVPGGFIRPGLTPRFPLVLRDRKRFSEFFVFPGSCHLCVRDPWREGPGSTVLLQGERHPYLGPVLT